VRIRDSWTSTDGSRHTVSLAYGVATDPPPTGGLGFAFPHHSGGFRASVAGETVGGLGTGSATALVRSDRFAFEGDTQADTRAFTWSRTPRRLAFSPSDPTAYELDYSLTVPRNGSLALGFADSEAVTTAAVRKLGSQAVTDMMPAPRITSPADGAVLTLNKKKTLTVKGVVTAGADGMPVSVKVNGVRASLTATGPSRATFTATVPAVKGKQHLTAVATDAGHNTRRTSITIRNK
jgi:hypothetical protein